MKALFLILVCIAFIAIVSCNDSGSAEGDGDGAADSTSAMDQIPQPDTTSASIDSATTTGDPTKPKFKPGTIKIQPDSVPPK